MTDHYYKNGHVIYLIFKTIHINEINLTRILFLLKNIKKNKLAGICFEIINISFYFVTQSSFKMNKTADTKKQLDEIRNLMEKSSRFISLSGLSGVSAGIIALLGALFAFFYLEFDVRYLNVDRYFNEKLFRVFPKDMYLLILVAIVILILAVGSAIFFTVRRAKRKNLKVWTPTTQKMLYNLAIPLIAGGIFCAILLWYSLIFLVAPATLLFYGLALLNASKFTLPEIQGLGISEIVLGLIGSVFVGYGLIFWIIGFGVLHILYGAIMYYRYERRIISSQQS